MGTTGCSFFPRIFNILPFLSLKDLAAIGCTENGQPQKKAIFNEHPLGEEKLGL